MSMSEDLGSVIVALIDERMSQFRTRLESVEKLLQLLVAHEVSEDGVHPLPGMFMLDAVTRTLIDKQVVSRDGLDLSMARLKGDIQQDWLNQFKTWSNNVQAEVETFKGSIMNRAMQLCEAGIENRFNARVTNQIEDIVGDKMNELLDGKAITLKVY